MSDRLSQLQTCLDQLVTQFFSSINYINKHHDYAPIGDEPKAEDPAHESAAPENFAAGILELSKDIATKAQQIELLIDSLPGLETSETNQMATVNELEKELQSVRQEQQQIAKERQDLARKCDDLILKITEEKVILDRGG